MSISLRLGTASLLASLALLVGCADQVGPDQDGPDVDGVTEEALQDDDKVQLFSDMHGGTSLGTFTQDVPDLAAVGADDLAWGIANEGTSAVTVYAGKNFQGRCQVIPAGVRYADLSMQDIGPRRISSLRFGATCAPKEVEVALRNALEGTKDDGFDLSFAMRFRVNPNELGGGKWSDPLLYGDKAKLRVSAHAWRYVVDVDITPAENVEGLAGALHKTPKWRHDSSYTVLADDGPLQDHTLTCGESLEQSAGDEVDGKLDHDLCR